MKNNKGFSLVEILATIVIIGIVSTVGIVAVNSMITKSRQHYYSAQEQQMVLAAQSYANDNRNILPRNVGGMIKIKLETLREKNYIKEDIVDQNKNVCDKDKSYVSIYKSSQSDYKYKGYLECPACRKGDSNACYTADQKTKPVINIDFPDFGGNNLMNKDKVVTIDIKSVSKPTEKPDIKVASYSYKIYVNNVLKYDSGTKIDNKRQTFSLTEKLYKYVPGVVKVVVTVTNTDGSTTSLTDSHNYNDAVKPFCGRVSYEGVNKMNTYDTQSGTLPKCGESGYKWVGIGSNPGNRVAWIVCNDVEGIGCAQHEFSQNFTSEGEDDQITIKDKNGYSETCTVKKCIDLTSSKITIDFYKADSNGNASGNTFKTYTADSQHTQANYTKTEEHTEWLNYAKAPNGIVVKVKVDEPMSKIKSFTWKINPKEQSLSNVTDANTTIKTKTDLNSSNEVTYWIKDDGVRKQDITVVDYAENTVRYVLTLRIDHTAPGIPTVNLRKWKDNDTQPTSATGLDAHSNNTWLSGKIFTFASGGADSPNVSGFDHFEYNATGETTNATNQSGSTRNVEAQGTSYIQYRSCDKAGNCSNYSANSTIKLDRKQPHCDISKTDCPAESGVTLVTSCSDAPASGAATSSGVKTCRENRPNITSDQTHTVVDHAGNSSTCSVSVYSKQRRTNTWDDCLTKECVYGCDTCTEEYDCKKCCQKEGSYICDDWECRQATPTCKTRKYDCNCSSCYTKKCVGGWKGWTNWANTNSTSCTENSSKPTKVDCRIRYH